MNPENDTELWAALLSQFPLVEYIVYGVVASAGALTRYFWDTLRGAGKLTFVGIMAYLFLGFFVGNLVGSFMPSDYEYRDGILLMTGFIVKELLDVIQNRATGISEKITNMLPIKGGKK